jgi:hypothetical protein
MVLFQVFLYSTHKMIGGGGGEGNYVLIHDIRTLSREWVNMRLCMQFIDQQLY